MIQVLPCCGFHNAFMAFPRKRPASCQKMSKAQVEMVAARGPPRSWHMWLGTANRFSRGLEQHPLEAIQNRLSRS